MHTLTARLFVGIVTVLVATAALGGPAVAVPDGPADAPEQPTDLPAIESTVSGETPSTQQVAPDQFEPNDDFSSAMPVDSGTYSGLSITSGDVDVYAVDLAPGEALSASITFSNAAGDLDLFLVGPGPDGVLQASSTTADTENVSRLATEPGTYYVAVVGYRGATNTYDLRVDRTGGATPATPATPTGTPGPAPTPDGTPTDAGEVEPNDDFATATPVEPGTYTDRELPRGDVDIYAVELAPGEALSASITFSNAAGDLDLFLVGPGGDEVLQASATTGDTEALTHVATEPGTYYVAVVGYQGATNTYDLTIDRTGGSVPPLPSTPAETPTTTGETPTETAAEPTNATATDA